MGKKGLKKKKVKNEGLENAGGRWEKGLENARIMEKRLDAERVRKIWLNTHESGGRGNRIVRRWESAVEMVIRRETELETD